MNTLKKIVAVIMVAAMALSFTACGDTSWIAKSDSESVPSGVYIYYQTEGYIAAGYELAAQDQQFYSYIYYGLSYLDQKIGDKPVTDYMNEYALKMSKQYLALNKLFDELGLELSADEAAVVSKQTNKLWDSNSEQLEDIGVSKESIRKVLESATKRQKVFNAYYEVGGKNGTTEEDIKSFIADNYARVKYMTFQYADSADDAVDEARKDQALKDAQSYLDRINAGEDINALIKEHNDEVAAANEAAQDEEADSENVKPDLPEAEDSAEDGAEEDVPQPEIVKPDENDPYANESIISKDSQYPSEKFVNYIFTEVKTGEVKLVQDDLNIYVVSKLDVGEREDYYTEKRETVISQMFDTDFNSKLNKELEGINVEVNDRSVKRYKPENAMKTEEK